jgi:hypothetical protein
MHVARVEQPHVCHCRMCQRATGGLFAALAGCRKEALEWTRASPRVFASSSLASRAYCADCGTPLTFAYNEPKARVYVTIGSLDDPEQAAITSQTGLESKLSWVKFCEDVPGHATVSDAHSEAFFKGMTSKQR